MKKKPKPRRPRSLRFPGYGYTNAAIWEGSGLHVDATDMSPNQARTLAAWLIKAADWIEAQETK